MHHAIAALSRAGNNVIADHVLVESVWADECAQLFADLPAYLIGLRCPLDVLEAREKARRNRTLGQAKAQFSIVHRYCSYDLEVNTSVDNPEICAKKVIERLKSHPTAFKKMAGQTT
jgi:chloramphenicol 3-O phosphotransferase